MRRDSHVARSDRSCDIKSTVSGSVSDGREVGGREVDGLAEEVRAGEGRLGVNVSGGIGEGIETSVVIDTPGGMIAFGAISGGG